ncbi:hypothetical protein PFISCL1PPCAC_17295, partial [Pristionchus fissidentatus]
DFPSKMEKSATADIFAHVGCHKTCDTSLIIHACGNDYRCNRAQKRPDSSIDCRDTDHVIHASANVNDSNGQIVEIFKEQTFDSLQCTKQGWKGNDKMLIDFSKYPKNEINIACRSKCSEKFTTCSGSNCPTGSNFERSCPNGSILRINDVQSMETIDCKPSLGWFGKNSRNVLVNFKNTDYRVTMKCEDSCTDTLVEDDCRGEKG